MQGSHDLTFMPLVLAIAACVVVVIVLVVVLALRVSSRRRQKLARFAAEHGFDYLERLPQGKPPFMSLGRRVYATAAAQAFLSRFEPCALFNDGTWRDVQNLISGERNGRHWLIFDYSYWSQSSGQSESEAARTTCVTLDAGRAIGEFDLVPKLPLIGALMMRFRRAGLVQTGDAEFDARFIVRSMDPAGTIEALVYPVRAYLLGLYRSPKRYFRQLYVHQHLIIIAEVTASVAYLEDMMDIAEGLLRAFGAEPSVAADEEGRS